MPNDSAPSFSRVTRAEVDRLWEEAREAVLASWEAQQRARDKLRRFETAFLAWGGEQ